MWVEYSELGFSIQEIAKRRDLSFGKVQSLLRRHPEYSTLAACRQREAPAAARSASFRQIDVSEALDLLEAGQGLRAVAARYGVSPRTLRKRLLPLERYHKVMADRGYPLPSNANAARAREEGK